MDRDVLAAERRRLPMVRIEKDYVFDGPDGKVGLLARFEGRRQLIIYHFMFATGVDGWPLAGCPGKQRMGWAVPWYSSDGTDFNDDFGASTAEGETFGLSVFLRDGDDVFHTYFTTDRGLEVIDSHFTLLDWTPLGRQEEWEDPPAGWSQSAPYVLWRRHDEYYALNPPSIMRIAPVMYPAALRSRFLTYDFFRNAELGILSISYAYPLGDAVLDTYRAFLTKTAKSQFVSQNSDLSPAPQRPYRGLPPRD